MEGIHDRTLRILGQKDLIMKTISIDEFIILVKREDWNREQDYDVIDHVIHKTEQYDAESDYVELIDIQHVFGLATQTSILNGIKITYTESFNYDEYDADSLSVGTEGQDDIWTVEGVSVIDEDGEALDVNELAHYLDSDFSSIDYSVLQIEEVTDIDVYEDTDMQTYTLEINNAPSIRFTGELIGSAASSPNHAMGDFYSGQTGRWTELDLYKTLAGKFICHKVSRTQWANDHDYFYSKICETIEEVKQFFGHKWLAKDLYYDADIEHVEYVA
ncbi:hypothetical protein LCGC14_0997360 [marine sediment metagenome]|uniref:Uncharacterized protein n=1 Tax=marine sediment metagenome TaxID=412755 RepID=A0A0F9N8R8_9ZZZZ